MRKISLSAPFIEADDVEAVNEVMRSGRLSLGPKLEEFEDALAEYTGRKYAVAMNSGTSALHIAVKCLGIGRGDRIIVPPFTFVASANCILYEGAFPIFMDIDPVTMNLDFRKVEDYLESTPYPVKSMAAVDVFGMPYDKVYAKILSEQYGFSVIEDSAESLGAGFRGQKTGSFGDISIFAFYPNKQITTLGEGGALLTDDKDVYRLAKSYTNQGREAGNHVRLGYNYRITESACAMGISQLSKIDRILNMRSKVAQWYRGRLKDCLGIGLPEDRDSWFVYVIRLTECDRDHLMKELLSRYIECSVYFKPLHLMPHYRELGYKKGMFPMCEYVSDRSLALPFHTGMSEEDVDYVCKSIKEILY
jgi:perosamine synthetase